MGTFDQRMQDLSELVGDGELRGTVSFSPGKIAGPQQLGGWVSGPLAGVRIRHYTSPGTGPDYLTGTLLENHERYLRDIANETLRAGPRAGMQRAVHDLLAISRRRIPRKSGKLAASGRAEVEG